MRAFTFWNLNGNSDSSRAASGGTYPRTTAGRKHIPCWNYRNGDGGGLAIQKLNGRVGAIYNPRRPDWDSSWKQSITDPQFAQQVNWEMDHIEKSNLAYFYFDPNSKSPITLMELGFVCGRRKSGTIPAVVCCPAGFWRRGNIEIMCARNGIPLYYDFEESIEGAIAILRLTHG